MNLFTGMTDHQVISVILAFVLFNGFVVLEAIGLAAFYVTSRPRRGRVRTAALWHAVACILFMLSLISTVWAAPAEKSFIDPTASGEPFFAGERFGKVLIGLGFAVVGIACLMIGAVVGSRQKRAAARDALASGVTSSAATPG